MNKINAPPIAAIEEAIRNGLVKQLLRDGKITEQAAAGLLSKTK